MVSEQFQNGFMFTSGVVQIALVVLVILIITNTLGDKNNAYADRMNQDVRKDDTVRFKNVLVDTSGSFDDKLAGNRSSNKNDHVLHVYRGADDSSTFPPLVVESRGSHASIGFHTADSEWIMGSKVLSGVDSFTIARNGEFGTNEVFSISNTDVFSMNGDLNFTGSTNATTLTVLNNTLTTADMVDISANRITSGSLMKLNSNSAVAASNVLEIISAAGAAIAPTGVGVTIADVVTGAAIGVDVTMAAATTNATGIQVTMDAATTADLVNLDNASTLTTGNFINCNDSGTTFFSVGALGVLNYRLKTEGISATNVITASESGTTFFMNNATGVVQTLPTLAAGLHFKFICTAAPSSNAYTIVATTNVIQGWAIVNTAVVPAANENTITFGANADPNDWVELTCDGTNWYCVGRGIAATSIVFTAP